MSYNTFIAIDWSGAKGFSHEGIQVAICHLGKKQPEIIKNKYSNYWSRIDLLEWLKINILKTETLVGMDFAFSLPYLDFDNYFPDSNYNLKKPGQIWDLVHLICEESEDFYTGKFISHKIWREYFRTIKYKGTLFDERYRLTDIICKNHSLGNPSSIFNLIGPKQVGLASLSGMILLKKIKEFSSKVGIWPFDIKFNSTIVEIFPRLFISRAFGGNRKINNNSDLNKILEFYGSNFNKTYTLQNDHQADAILSSAAMRNYVLLYKNWEVEINKNLFKNEGAMFGLMYK